jgi:hypothetical protein
MQPKRGAQDLGPAKSLDPQEQASDSQLRGPEHDIGRPSCPKTPPEKPGPGRCGVNLQVCRLPNLRDEWPESRILPEGKPVLIANGRPPELPPDDSGGGKPYSSRHICRVRLLPRVARFRARGPRRDSPLRGRQALAALQMIKRSKRGKQDSKRQKRRRASARNSRDRPSRSSHIAVARIAHEQRCRPR